MKSLARIVKMLSILNTKNNTYDEARTYAQKLLWEQVHLSKIRRKDAEYILNLEDYLNQLPEEELIKEIKNSISAELTCCSAPDIDSSLRKIQDAIKNAGAGAKHYLFFCP